MLLSSCCSPYLAWCQRRTQAVTFRSQAVMIRSQAVTIQRPRSVRRRTESQLHYIHAEDKKEGWEMNGLALVLYSFLRFAGCLADWLDILDRFGRFSTSSRASLEIGRYNLQALVHAFIHPSTIGYTPQLDTTPQLDALHNWIHPTIGYTPSFYHVLRGSSSNHLRVRKKSPWDRLLE